jgi:hypothetical protein
MASSGKRKTTFAKLARESRLRERRLEKQARKEARKRAAENPSTETGTSMVLDEYGYPIIGGEASDPPVAEEASEPRSREA